MNRCHPSHSQSANRAHRPGGYRMMTRKVALRVGTLPLMPLSASPSQAKTAPISTAQTR